METIDTILMILRLLNKGPKRSWVEIQKKYGYTKISRFEDDLLNIQDEVDLAIKSDGEKILVDRNSGDPLEFYQKIGYLKQTAGQSLV